MVIRKTGRDFLPLPVGKQARTGADPVQTTRGQRAQGASVFARTVGLCTAWHTPPRENLFVTAPVLRPVTAMVRLAGASRALIFSSVNFYNTVYGIIKSSQRGRGNN